jgi:multiple antibiotic resistance protein
MKITRIEIVAIGVVCLHYPSIASAGESAVQYQQLPLAQIFTFLFLMLGPFKIIGPFAKVTKGMDAVQTRKIALEAVLFSILALLLAALVGEIALDSYGIPLPILALSAGLILFLVALINILKQFEPFELENEESKTVEQSSKFVLKVALAPLAFPTIVTPYGIAALVVFLALSPDLQGRFTIGAIVFAIMLLNLFVMIMQRRIFSVLSIALPILGAVLGIVQVALGLRIIHNSLKMMGLL